MGVSVHTVGVYQNAQSSLEGGREYDSKLKYAKQSTEGTSQMGTLFVHILKHASMQASMESMQKNMTQPSKKITQHFSTFQWRPLCELKRENTHSNFGRKCCLFISHMLSDYNI